MLNLTKKSIAAALALVIAGSATAGGSCDNSNLSAWDVNKNPDSLMNVTAGAAMGGTDCGLELTTGQASNPGDGDDAKTYVADEGSPEMRYRGAFCLNPNGIVLPTSGQYRQIRFLSTQCMGSDCAPGGGNVLTMKLRNNGTAQNSDTQVYLWVRDFEGLDSQLTQRTEWTYFDIDDNAPSRIEYDLDVTNGSLKVWVNATAESDTPIYEVSGLNLAHADSPWNGGVRKSRLGMIERFSNTQAGQTYFIDEAEWRRQTFIGGTCN